MTRTGRPTTKARAGTRVPSRGSAITLNVGASLCVRRYRVVELALSAVTSSSRLAICRHWARRALASPSGAIQTSFSCCTPLEPTRMAREAPGTTRVRAKTTGSLIGPSPVAAPAIGTGGPLRSQYEEEELRYLSVGAAPGRRSCRRPRNSPEPLSVQEGWDHCARSIGPATVAAVSRSKTLSTEDSSTPAGIPSGKGFQPPLDWNESFASRHTPAPLMHA